MARKLILQNLMRLAKDIGANQNKFMGTRSNITFLGKGPTKNPLFQGPVPGIEEEVMSITLGGTRGASASKQVISAVEDAMGYASAGKLNDIQLKALTLNLESINKALNPPVLPTITDMATRTRNLDIRDLRALRSGVDPKAPGYIRQGDPITAENFGASQFAPSEASLKARAMAQFNKDFAARVAAQADIPQKTASARATMYRLLDMETGRGGLTLREIMSPQDLKWLLEGGGGAKGDPIALFAKYFGAASAKQVIRRKDRLGRGINDPFFNPEDITFAHGGLARILEV